MASPPVRYYGAKPDSPDPRDHKKRFALWEIPRHGSKDLREYVPFVYNQGQLGSCTANAVCAAYAIDLKKEGKEVFKPSIRKPTGAIALYAQSRVHARESVALRSASLFDGLYS